MYHHTPNKQTNNNKHKTENWKKMATTMTTKPDRRIVINADGEKIYIIRRYLQPMTLQIESTMFSTCKMLFRTQIAKFELLPIYDGYRHGTWALYTEYRGLHYYLLIYDKPDYHKGAYRTDKSFVFDKTKHQQYYFEAVRTNYKIPELIMMPSEIKQVDDEISYRFYTKHGIQKSNRKTDIGEKLFYTDCNYIGEGPYSLYTRDERDNYNYHYCIDLSGEQEELIDYVVLPYGYISSFDEKHYTPREKGKNFIQYDAPEIVSIPKELFNDTVDTIFKNARQKRFEKSALLVREITPLNDNCIEYVLQYVF